MRRPDIRDPRHRPLGAARHDLRSGTGRPGPPDRLRTVGLTGAAAVRHDRRHARHRGPDLAADGHRDRALDLALDVARLRADRLVASWSARTPGDSAGASRSRPDWPRRPRAGTRSRSAAGDRHVRRTTSSGQADDLGSVAVDTWRVPGGVTSYQVRLTLTRAAGQASSPSVDTVGAVASWLPDVSDVPPPRGPARPGASCSTCRATAMIHSGEFPGTAAAAVVVLDPTSMVLGYYDALPWPADYRWWALALRPVGRLRGADDLRLRLRRHRNSLLNTAYAARSPGTRS